MNKLKCIAIDDEPLALSLIRSYVARFPSLELINTFEDAISGAEYLQRHSVDLLFVDINMPDITGIDLVRSLDPRPMVIFTTAYKNFALEGFELEALDYLLKPIDQARFKKAVDRAIDFYAYKHPSTSNAQQDHLYVFSEYRQVKINLAEVEYMESMEDYVKIYSTGQPKPVITLVTLKKMLEKLPQDRFKRIHRSYIIAVDKVKFIHNRKLSLTEAELPIGESYTESVRHWKTT